MWRWDISISFYYYTSCVSGSGGGDGDDSGPALLADPTLLLQHIKEVKQERDKATSRYEQVRGRTTALDYWVDY